jgi:methylmalonyl-CoA mutase N-terminal domain/subunit
VADFVDPLGGAYALERLTDEIEAKAEAYLKRIDDLGGMVRAIAEGFPQREIQEAAYRAQKGNDAGDDVVVGVNRFADEAERVPPPRLKLDPALEQRQSERVRAFRKARDSAASGKALLAVGAAARGKENLMPRLLEAVQVGATLGEVADALRDVFGEHREAVVL